MTKEDIKKAAEEYAKEACRPLWRAGYEQVCMVDFMEGAEWYKNQSSWISVDERLPELNVRVLVAQRGINRTLQIRKTKNGTGRLQTTKMK